MSLQLFMVPLTATLFAMFQFPQVPLASPGAHENLKGITAVFVTSIVITDGGASSTPLSLKDFSFEPTASSMLQEVGLTVVSFNEGSKKELPQVFVTFFLKTQGDDFLYLIETRIQEFGIPQRLSSRILLNTWRAIPKTGVINKAQLREHLEREAKDHLQFLAQTWKTVNGPSPK